MPLGDRSNPRSCSSSNCRPSRTCRTSSIVNTTRGNSSRSSPIALVISKHASLKAHPSLTTLGALLREKFMNFTNTSCRVSQKNSSSGCISTFFLWTLYDNQMHQNILHANGQTSFELHLNHPKACHPSIRNHGPPRSTTARLYSHCAGFSLSWLRILPCSLMSEPQNSVWCSVLPLSSPSVMPRSRSSQGADFWSSGFRRESRFWTWCLFPRRSIFCALRKPISIWHF